MRFVIPLLFLTLLACSPQPDGETGIDGTLPTVVGFEPNYNVIQEESRLGFSATQEGKAFSGEFKEFTAVIRFNPDDLSTFMVHVRVPIRSVDASSGDRNSALLDKAWFDEKAFPVAEFTSETVWEEGAGYVAEGTLSIKGNSLPLSLPFILEGTADRTIMRSTLSLNRTLWNIGEAPWNTEEYVGHEVTLDIVLVAEQRD